MVSFNVYQQKCILPVSLLGDNVCVTVCEPLCARVFEYVYLPHYRTHQPNIFLCSFMTVAYAKITLVVVVVIHTYFIDCFILSKNKSFVRAQKLTNMEKFGLIFY